MALFTSEASDAAADAAGATEAPASSGTGGGLFIPTNEPVNPNQSGWADEMDSSTWLASLWSAHGSGVSPTRLTDLTAWQYTLTGGQRVEISSLLAPTRLDAWNSSNRVLGRMAATSTQEYILGIVNDQADAIGVAPTSGVWIQRSAAGDCSLNWAEAGASDTVAFAFPLPPAGYWDVALVIRTDEGAVEAVAFVAGVPVARLQGLDAPTGWLYPRVGVKGAGSLALDRMGRATLGHPTGEYLT